MRAREGDAEILREMRTKPLGTPRTLEERMAFEREWDDRVEAGRHVS